MSQCLFAAFDRRWLHIPTPQHAFQNPSVRTVIIHYENLQASQNFRRRNAPHFNHFHICNSHTGREVKLRPARDFAVHPDFSAHHSYQALRNGQAQTGAAVPPCCRRIGLGKGIKNHLLLFWEDPNSCIRYRKVQDAVLSVPGVCLNMQRHFPFARKLDGVPHKIQYNLAQSARIAIHNLRHVGSNFAKQLQPLFVRPHRECFQCCFQTIA